MVIEIKRYRFSPYGVDGMVVINGRRVCATVEHPHNYLPAGCYPVTLAADKALRRRVLTLAQGATIRPGNGAMTLKDGSIIVGRQHIPGVVVRSGEEFGRLFERIEKNVKRRKGVVVVIG